MYDIKNNTVKIDDKPEPILTYEVWFQVPMCGITPNREEAIEACEKCDLDPNLCIIPVPVAVTENSYEILLK